MAKNQVNNQVKNQERETDINQIMTMNHILMLTEREALNTKRVALEIENTIHNDHMYAISMVNKKRTTRIKLLLVPNQHDLVGMTLYSNDIPIWCDFTKCGDFKTVEYERIIQGLIMTLIYQEVRHDEEMLSQSDK